MGVLDGNRIPFFVVANDASAQSKGQAWKLCDGTADDVQIQAAIDALPAVGGKVVLSEGTFTLAAKITITDDNVNIVGAGKEATRIAAGDNLTRFEVKGTHRTSGRIRNTRFESFSLIGAAYTGVGFDAKYADLVIMRDILCEQGDDNAIYAEECWIWHLDNVAFQSCGDEVATVTDTSIAFVDGNGGNDSITDSNNGFGSFSVDDVIFVLGSVSNDGKYTVLAASAGTLEVATASLTAEGAAASVTVSTGKSAVKLYNGADDRTNDWTFTGCRWENSNYICVESDAGGGGSTNNSKFRFTDCKFENLTANPNIEMVKGPFAVSGFIGCQFMIGEQAAINFGSGGDNNRVTGCYFESMCGNGGTGDIDIDSHFNVVIGNYFAATGASQHISLNGNQNVIMGNGKNVQAIPMVLDSGGNNRYGDNLGRSSAGDVRSISKVIDHADIVDDGGASGHADFAETIPAGSIIKAVKLDFTEAFNSDATSALKVKVGPQADDDDFSKTATPGDEAFNTTTDDFWGESACQDPVVVAAAAPRITFTEDGTGDITDIISGGNAAGGVTITITYMKA